MILLECLLAGLKVFFLLIWHLIKFLALPIGIIFIIGFIIGIISFFTKAK